MVLWNQDRWLLGVLVLYKEFGNYGNFYGVDGERSSQREEKLCDEFGVSGIMFGFRKRKIIC